jgi:hypothetical protein
VSGNDPYTMPLEELARMRDEAEAAWRADPAYPSASPSALAKGGRAIALDHLLTRRARAERPRGKKA